MWDTNSRNVEHPVRTARKADYRERARLAEQDAGTPWEGLVDEEREQAIRDHYGYAKSETRTQAERQAVPDRMQAKSKARAQE